MKDCFAYKNKECTIFKTGKCEGLDCGFYKTKEESEADRIKSIERIVSLDREKREHINQKYYDGNLEV